MKHLVSKNDFIESTGSGMNDVRMGARECALRFSAFYPRKWESYDENDLNSYLNQSMKDLNKAGHDHLSAIDDSFSRSMRAATSIFGNQAFRKPTDRGGLRKPLSKPLFEAWSVNLAQLDSNAISALAARKLQLMDKFRLALDEDPWFERSITVSTGTAKSVSIRFQTVRDIIGETLGVFG